VKYPAKQMLRPVLFVVAAAYMLVDALFMTVAKPLADWIARRQIFYGLREWIVSLKPYPTLALFAVPVIILEPVKPVAAYLAATGHVVIAFTVLAVGEILKLVLLERLFSLSRNKLMSIYAFAWAYDKYQVGKAWLEATDAWQLVRRVSGIVRSAARRVMMDMRNLQRPERHSPQLR
jgi:hypothetical protein